MSDITIEVREEETPNEIVERLLLELPKSFLDPARRPRREAPHVRALVVSDLHSNAEALRVVMNRVRRKKFDQVICLGDFVGYGAQPNQVLDTMRTMSAPKLYIRGNHDRVAAGLDDADGFNHAAKAAALWTRDHLSAPQPPLPARSSRSGRSMHEDVLLCHGSPHDEDEYVFNEHHARADLRDYRRAVHPLRPHAPAGDLLDRPHYRVRGVAVRGDVDVPPRSAITAT